MAFACCGGGGGRAAAADAKVAAALGDAPAAFGEALRAAYPPGLAAWLLVAPTGAVLYVRVPTPGRRALRERVSGPGACTIDSPPPRSAQGDSGGGLGSDALASAVWAVGKATRALGSAAGAAAPAVHLRGAQHVVSCYDAACQHVVAVAAHVHATTADYFDAAKAERELQPALTALREAVRAAAP